MKPISYKTITAKARSELNEYATKVGQAKSAEEARECYGSAKAIFLFWISLVGLNGPEDFTRHYEEFDTLVNDVRQTAYGVRDQEVRA